MTKTMYVVQVKNNDTDSKGLTYGEYDYKKDAELDVKSRDKTYPNLNFRIIEVEYENKK